MLVHSYSHGIILLKAEIRVNNQIVFTATQKCVVFNLINKRMHKGGITEFVNKFTFEFPIHE
jgi:hypothetical protein